MKKVLVLALSLCVVTTLFAQSRNQRKDSRDVVLGQDRSIYNDRRYDRNLTPREREMLIAQIRKDYRWRIESVKRDRYIRNSEKKRKIRILEQERDAKINAVWQRSNDQNNNRYGRRY